jgi:hypothetical protein
VKNLLLLICLFIVGVTSAQAQVSAVGSTHAAANNGAAKWSVQFSPRTGDTLLVGCDYAVGISLAGVSDTAGDSFSPIGPEVDSAFAARAFIATNVRGGTTTVSCNAASGSDTNEIYVTEFNGVNPGVPIDTYSALSGSTSSAKGAVTTSHPNELVWGYVVTGHASDPSGWNKLSTYDGNLVADHSQTTPGTLSASFPVTMGWTLVLVALEPAGTSGSSGGGSTPISVSVTPPTASVQVSQSSHFTASLQNDTQNQGVTWALSGSGCSGATCGSLTAVTTTSATYVAPAALPSPASVTLRATSVADPTESASSTITLTAAAAISVSVTPASASVQVSHSMPFSAALKNDTQNKGVFWSLSGSGCSGAACGTLTNATTTNVTYAAPTSVPSPATITLKATSVADSTKSASSTITATAAPAISVSVNPASASVQISQTAGFTAILQNDPQDRGVTWSLAGSGCSGSACGTLTSVTTTSVTYNAPAAAPSPANVTLTAKSVADTTKSGSASISITNPSNDPPGGPTLVWSKSAANTTGLSVNGYISNLPTAGTLSGNVVIATFQYSVGSGATASLKDDQGDSFTLLASNSNSNQTVATFCGTPKAGARVLTLTFSGGTPAYVAMINASEWYNLTCSRDGSATASGSSKSVSTTSFSTTADGDLIYQAAEEDGNTSTEQWTAGSSPWSLLSASSGLAGANTPQAAQFQVQTAHGAITPSLSMSAADSWNSVAVALQAASSGTAPAPGMRILHLQEEAIPAGLAGAIKVQFPSSGNLLISATIDSPGFDVTGVADSNGNSHVQIGGAFSNADSGDVQTFYAANAATSNSLSLTFSMTGSPTGGSDFFLYDVTGASSAPYDSAAGRQTASGQQASSGNVAGPVISPSVANGLVIAQIAVSTNSIVGVSPGYFAGSIPSPLGQTNPTNENNGWAFDYPASTSSRQYLWLTQGGDVWNWASTVVSFLPQ